MSGGIASLSELGLTDRDGIVRIMPEWRHRDVRVDDFGPEVPAEIQWQLASVRVSMTLVHYDRSVLDQCMMEAMGGSASGPLQAFAAAGVLVPAGQTLGRYKAMFSSGNHYISLNIDSRNSFYPWRIRTCYLEAPPLKIPLGTRRSHVELSWRGIPYTVPMLVSGGTLGSSPPGLQIGSVIFTSGKEILSSGIVLWDHRLDT